MGFCAVRLGSPKNHLLMWVPFWEFRVWGLGFRDTRDTREP